MPNDANRSPLRDGQLMFRHAVAAAALLVGINAAALADGLQIALVLMTAQVAPGGTVTLVIQTEPGATCEGNRQGHFGDGFSVPLPRQRIGDDGRAQWEWSVLRGSHPIGLRRVHVTCIRNGRSGSLDTAFDIK
jgi:hypothetical protein